MTGYEELVKALRICSSELNCGDCPLLYRDSCSSDELMADAAAAIEALNRLLDQNTQRCEALRKQLREAHESYERHLNELEAQLPKRGEIVRCGECKYHLPETERTNPYCNRFHCMKPDDWFCADGEREVQE